MGKRILYLFLTVILSIGMFSAAKILAHADETSVPLTGKPVLSDVSNLLVDYILHDGDDKFDLTGLKIAVEGTDQTISPDQVTWIIDGEDTEGSTLTVTEVKTWHIACRIKGGSERSDDLSLTVLPARVPQTPVLADDPYKPLLADYILHDGDDKFDLSRLSISADDQYDDARPVNSDDVTWIIDGADIEGSTLTVTESRTWHIACRINGHSERSNDLTLTVLPARAPQTPVLANDPDKPLLADYILHDGDDKFDLSRLSISADDQYGDAWPVNSDDVTWVIDGGDIEGSTLTVTEAKTYHIACRVDSSPKSNELTLKVLPAQVTYTVTFNANGGSGTMPSKEVEADTEFTLPENGFGAPDGKVFDKWDAGAPGEKIDVTGDMTIKAAWKDKGSEPEPVPPTPPTPPTPPEEPEHHHEHSFVWEVTKQPTPVKDGEMVYACTECGAVAQRLPISGYIAFNEEVAAKIRNAKPGAELVVMTEKWISFYSVVWDELAKRPDVTLVIDYKYNGRMFEVVVPAGTNVETIKNNEGYAGFLFLSGKFGRKEIKVY